MPTLTAAKEAKILKISEVRAQYPKQWVTVDITQRDEYGLAKEGRVVLSAKSQNELVNQILKNNIKGELYIFYTGCIDDKVA